MVELPSFLQQLGQGPGTLTVMRGGQSFQNVNFVVGLNRNGMRYCSVGSDIVAVDAERSRNAVDEWENCRHDRRRNATAAKYRDCGHGDAGYVDDNCVRISQRVGKRIVVPAGDLVQHRHDEGECGWLGGCVLFVGGQHRGDRFDRLERCRLGRLCTVSDAVAGRCVSGVLKDCRPVEIALRRLERDIPIVEAVASRPV